MSKKENPTPRVNAEHRAEGICCKSNYIEKPIGLEGNFAAIFVARPYRLAMPLALAIIALASLGRAI